jgi:uncharacterized protein (DUF1919 family)
MNSFLRKFYNLYNRKRLKNTEVTLVASNCNGGCILNDLHMRFNSPFINLWIMPDDFIRLCGNMKYYMGCKLDFVCEEGISYPIGKLDDIKIYFQHYASKEEAEMLWNKRKQRMDFENVWILFTDREGCTYDDLKRFDRLDYKYKVVFCNKKYPEIKSAQYIPGFENEDCVGMCMAYENKYTYKKFYDSFDYVSWFNCQRN